MIHRLWVATDHNVISKVKAGLRDKPVFIADGHHRYETALNYRRELKAAGKLNDDTSAPNFVMMHFVGMQDAGLRRFCLHSSVGFGTTGQSDIGSGRGGIEVTLRD